MAPLRESMYPTAGGAETLDSTLQRQRFEASFFLPNGQELNLSIVRDSHQLHEVGRFRYDEHVVRLGKAAMHAQHDRALLLEPLDGQSTIICAHTPEDVIGVVRVTLRPDFAEQIPWMTPILGADAPSNASYVSRLLVREAYRGTCVARQLFSAAFDLGASAGIERCYIYSAAALVKYYQRWGFVRMDGIVRHHDDGEQIPMCLNLRDMQHLHRIRSPFRRNAATGSPAPAPGSQSGREFDELGSQHA